ncbi:MAG TPA: tetratricopeptide repeat protein [Opitutales bacterium]|jgi:tetratricopeptide (TPR) repeat protein|nr:tetratricopeptide repeat protein [Opitutales bacterium]
MQKLIFLSASLLTAASAHLFAADMPPPLPVLPDIKQPASSSTTTPSAPAAPTPPTTPQTSPSNLADWESHVPSPTTPTRGDLVPGYESFHPARKSQPPPAPDAPVNFSSLPALPPPPSTATGSLLSANVSDDDALAPIALDDRDFFTALVKNPNTWTADERDRRAQEIHDRYFVYIVAHPRDVNAIVLYGKLLRRTGQYDQAFAAFQYADTLDPNLAVVKQQLANHYAESGGYAQALVLLRRAAELAPTEAVYHYQIGELINFYYDSLATDGAHTPTELDHTLEAEFARAAALAPGQPAYAWRHAECFYDQSQPDWAAAFAAWGALAKQTTSPALIEMIRLHIARALLELKRYDDAKPFITAPVRPALEPSRAELARRLAHATARASAS